MAKCFLLDLGNAAFFLPFITLFSGTYYTQDAKCAISLVKLNAALYNVAFYYNDVPLLYHDMVSSVGS
jgi:hypothetical protein